MQRKALDTLGAAIKANTERRTLDELKAQGKKHVRVVSGEKVLRIIQAIVGDIVDSEVGEITQQDRSRIVKETQRRFDRVLKMQTEQEDRLAEMREDLAKADREAERLRGDNDFLERQLAEARTSAGESAAVLFTGARR